MAEEENKRLSELDILMNDVKGKHSKRANAVLATMEDEDFIVNYFKILEYASPKLQRKEIIEEEKDNVIKIEHTYRGQKETE
jgi:hypothetical protein